MEEIGNKAVRGFRWLALGRFGGQLITWSITIIVIRILSPDDYGLMAMATIVIGFLALFDELGMGAALVQRDKLTDEQISKVFGLTIVINLSAFLVLYLTAPFIADFFSEPRLTDITRVLSLQFPLQSFMVIPDAMIRRRMEFRGKSIVNFIAMVAGSIATLGLALAGNGVWSLVIGNLVTVAIRITGFNIVARYFCWPNFRFAGLGKIIVFGGQVTAERFLWFIYTQADIFLVGRILGKELLGYYSVALNLAMLPVNKLAGLVNEISFSGFSRIQGDQEQVSAQLEKATLAIGFFAFPVFFGISATAPEIVATVLGEKWTQATLPLQLLSLVIPLRMLDLVIPTALLGIGRAEVTVGNAAIGAVILPLSFFIGLQWGLTGVCYAWLVGYSLFFLISLARSLPVLGLSFGRYFAACIGPGLSAGAMLLAVHGVRQALPDAWGGGFLSLMTLTLVGGAVFGGLVLLFQRDTLRFVISLVARR